MGRQQYLNRLALGRSAFQEYEPEESPSPANESQTPGGQRYDSKGRPINPETEAYNAAMRQAQNEVLALVGVVERKDRADRLDEMRSRLGREARQNLLALEQDRGEILELIAIPLSFISHLWLDAFVQRIQIGFYDVHQPMTAILRREWRAIAHGGLKNALVTLFPGVGDTLVYFLVKLPIVLGVEQVAGRLQNYAGQTRLGRKSRKEVFMGISLLVEAVVMLVDIAFLPMDFYASAQRLGLAPLLPLFPPRAFFLPWRQETSPFHQFGWKPTLGLALIRSFTSPAALLLLGKLLHRNDNDDDESPICAAFTSFRYPPVDDNPSHVQLANPFYKDPFGWILFHMWSFRSRILRNLGWNVIKIDPFPSPENQLENDTILPQDDTTESVGGCMPVSSLHRSTGLALLPVQFLATAIDAFFARVLTLPFEALLSRTIAAAYMASSSLPKTPEALRVASRLYLPFSGGPFARLYDYSSTRSSLTEVSGYVSKLRLGLALHCSMDLVLFAGVYGCTRYMGVKYLEWGRKKTDGPETGGEEANASY